jgi:hypothetical protein
MMANTCAATFTKVFSGVIFLYEYQNFVRKLKSCSICILKSDVFCRAYQICLLNMTEEQATCHPNSIDEVEN